MRVQILAGLRARYRAYEVLPSQQFVVTTYIDYQRAYIVGNMR